MPPSFVAGIMAAPSEGSARGVELQTIAPEFVTGPTDPSRADPSRADGIHNSQDGMPAGDAHVESSSVANIDDGIGKSCK